MPTMVEQAGFDYYKNLMYEPVAGIRIPTNQWYWIEMNIFQAVGVAFLLFLK